MEAPEIILVDKPVGITSFDVIRRLRPVFKFAKMGHAGTLDPNASGLMILGLGKGTKRMSEFLKLPKTYEAVIFFGKETDSGDITGNVVRTSAEMPDFNKLKNIIEEYSGIHTIAVPVYSAIKRNGKPLYAYAREGEKVDTPEKDMEVISTYLMGVDPDQKKATVFFNVGSGTYIRSLVTDIADKMGVPATLFALRRTSIGNFNIAQAKKIEDF